LLACKGPAQPGTTSQQTAPHPPAKTPTEQPTPQIPNAPKRGPSPLCDAALGEKQARLPEPSEAIQKLVQAHDKTFGRTDYAAVEALLHGNTGTQNAFRTLEFASMIAGFRGHLRHAAEAEELEARRRAWDDAACLWELRLRGFANQTNPERDAGPALVAEVEAAFLAGRQGFANPDLEALNRAVLPARQRIEKSLYRALHRDLTDAVERAAAAPKAQTEAIADELTRARQDLGWFADRLETKNTPGLAWLQQALAGPSAPDPAAVLRELNIAFAKRTRKYCSDAAEHPERPLALRLASAAEGATYMRMILPDMARLLADEGFDPETYRDSWQQLQRELADNPDPQPEDPLNTIAAELTRWNCAYQLKLGILECTSTQDEQASH